VTLVPPLQCIEVGVVVERRKAKSQWIDFIWRPAAILPGRPEAAPGTALAGDGDCATFYAGPANLELYRTETGQYRDNLASGAPSLWVALRPTGANPAYEVVGVTADPAEGESWTLAGGDLVDAVPMPTTVRDAIEAFVTEHHVERPFVKRKRDRSDPDVLAGRRPLRENDADE
jgi:Protein of unknown function (DUF3305)